MSELHQSELEQIYEQATALLKENKNIAISSPDLPEKIINNIDLITDRVEYVLGINNVLITSLTEKIVNKNQDVRLHQAKMDGGYSGRTLDTKYIAPFLKSKGLRSMVESGWLTRSLEQGYPYNLEYKGAIKNKNIKKGHN